MHPNPAFRTAPRQENLAFARERGFGVLAVSGGSGPPMISHVPFLLAPDGNSAELHLVRSNPIARADMPVQARLAVSGPDTYVSPDWYRAPDQVPTWNYVAVHLSGQLTAMPDADLPGLLDRLSAFFEERLEPKQPWTRDKMDPASVEKMMRMIRPFRLEIEQIDGTWKLGQNKPDAARVSAAEHIDAYGIGSETRMLAALMRRPPGSNDS